MSLLFHTGCGIESGIAPVALARGHQDWGPREEQGFANISGEAEGSLQLDERRYDYRTRKAFFYPTFFCNKANPAILDFCIKNRFFNFFLH